MNIMTTQPKLTLMPERWQPLRRSDATELSRLFRQAAARGFAKGRLAVVYEYAHHQLINGDPEYNASPTLHTILRRVIKGEYDALFN
jgi:hypothetical protein